MSVDLLFSGALVDTSPPVDLVFGEDTLLRTLAFAGTLPAPTGTISLEQDVVREDLAFSGMLPAPTGSFALEQAILEALAFSGTLPAPAGTVSLEWDANVPEYTQRSTSTAWHHGARSDGAAGAAWAPAAACSPSARRLPWRMAAPISTPIKALPWHSGARSRPTPVALPWHHGTRNRPAGTRVPWQAATRSRPTPVALPWQQGARLGSAADLPWRQGARLWTDRVLAWRDGTWTPIDTVLPWQGGAAIAPSVRLPWQQGTLIETHGGSPWPPVVTPPVHVCYTPPPGGMVDLLFAQRYDGSTNLLFECHPLPSLAVVPVRKVYIVINDTHLIKLDGMIELPTYGMQLTLDVDSWTWGFSATLPADQLPLVTPDAYGTPVMVAAVINSVSYYMLVESIQRDRSFGSATIRIGGRGKNAILDAPYAITQSFSNSGAARTAVQLLDDALKLNGVSIGWDVDHDLTDWLVPAGAWSVAGSHIAAAQSVAGAAGAYLQPHATDDTLRVLARYPTAPWEWGSVTPDIILPSSVTLQEGITWVEKARYNRVFVSGQGQGKLCQVTRTGTAGDLVAPLVTDALITHADAGRQRGLRVLSDTGRIATVSLRLPVLPETGIILPGKFVRYNDTVGYRLGIVRSTAVDVGHPEVWQTIGVETHE